MTAPTDELLVALVDRLRCVAGDQVPHGVVQVLHEHLGAEGVALYLLDRRLQVLHPVAVAGLGDRLLAPHTVTGTSAGEAARSDRVLRSSTAGRDTIDLPISIRGERLGVCEITITEGPEGAVREPDEQQLRRVAATVAVFLLQANSTTDAIESARRSYDYSITAELQWQLLAPPGLVTDRFGLHAFVEPASQISTDLYDWALTENIVSLTLLDAAGHRRAAAQSADLALAALRTARRYGNDLAEQASLADQAIYDSHRGKSTVDALLVEIDLDADTARAIHTGRGHALRRRRGVVSALASTSTTPSGCSRAVPTSPRPSTWPPVTPSSSSPTASPGPSTTTARRTASNASPAYSPTPPNRGTPPSRSSASSLSTPAKPCPKTPPSWSSNGSAAKRRTTRPVAPSLRVRWRIEPWDIERRVRQPT